MARLRVHGEVVPDPRLLPGVFDLAAAEHGGRVVACSNMFYGAPQNLLAPGLARVMGDGWETARRRDDGNDWVLVRLAAPGMVEFADLDTSHFKGNAPGPGGAARRRRAHRRAGRPGGLVRPAAVGTAAARTPGTAFPVTRGAGAPPTFGWTSSPTAAWPGCACTGAPTRTAGRPCRTASTTPCPSAEPPADRLAAVFWRC